QLPSGLFLEHPCHAIGRVAEVSKAMVCPTARNCGLYTALLLECEKQSVANEVSHLFISVTDTDRIRRFLQAEGFVIWGSSFRFEDEKISPNVAAISLCNSLSSSEDFVRSITARQDRILSDAQAALQKRAET